MKHKFSPLEFNKFGSERSLLYCQVNSFKCGSVRKPCLMLPLWSSSCSVDWALFVHHTSRFHWTVLFGLLSPSLLVSMLFNMQVLHCWRVNEHPLGLMNDQFLLGATCLTARRLCVEFAFTLWTHSPKMVRTWLIWKKNQLNDHLRSRSFVMMWWTCELVNCLEQWFSIQIHKEDVLKNQSYGAGAVHGRTFVGNIFQCGKGPLNTLL